MSHFGTKLDLHEYYSSNQQRYSYLIVANLEMAHPVLTLLMTHTLFKQLAHIKLMIHTILISLGASGSSEVKWCKEPHLVLANPLFFLSSNELLSSRNSSKVRSSSSPIARSGRSHAAPQNYFTSKQKHYC